VARRSRKLHADIETQVRQRLESNECIQSWNELRAGEVTVFLIDQELHRICQESVRRFGRGAGTGRTLCFRLTNGAWVFTGVGGWIS
jgi:hypothetical protein